jgi:hypothetical protein
MVLPRRFMNTFPFILVSSRSPGLCSTRAPTTAGATSPALDGSLARQKSVRYDTNEYDVTASFFDAQSQF